MKRFFVVRRRNTRAMSFVALLLFSVVTSLVSPFSTPKAAAEDYEGKFIDAVSISIDGIGVLIDDNPWGDGQTGTGVAYDVTVGTDKDGNPCNTEVDGYSGGGSIISGDEFIELNVKVRKLNDVGQCIEDGDKSGKVTMSDTNKSQITAYRHDNGTSERGDDIIFLPAYRVITASAPYTAISALNGVFTRLPADTQISSDNCNVETDCFVQLSGGRHDNIDTGGEWVETVPPTLHYKFCPDTACSVLGAYEQISLVFANGGDPIANLPAAYDDVDLETGGGGGGGGGDSADTEPSCESTGFALSWIFCPLVTGMAETADGMFDYIIKPMLYTPDVGFTDPSSPTYQVWSSFRVLANILLVIAMLVIVFGQAIGGGLVDAYTAKKSLPRILIAAILINISIYLVVFAVDVTNVIAEGISGLLYAPFQANDAFEFKLSQGGAGLGFAGIIGGIFAVGIIGIGALLPVFLLFVLLPAVLAIVGVVFTLIIRRGLILFLIVASPVAFALYCLPNTEKYFSKWWELFIKALMVYPIIVAIFALADILAVTIDLSTASDSPLVDIIGDLMSIVLLVLPLFLIPYAFKLAGGALATMHGAIVGTGGKLGEVIKGNPNNPESLRNKTKRGVGEAATRGQGRYIRGGDSVGASWQKRAMGRVAGAGIFGNYDARMSQYNKLAAERQAQLSDTGNDRLVYAAGGFKGDGVTKDAKTGEIYESGKYYNSKGEEITAGTYKRGKALYGNSMHSIGQSLGYRLGKVQTDQDLAQFRTAVRMNQQQEGWNKAEMDDVWASATYPKKGQFSTEWYSKPEIQSDGSIGFRDISNDDKSYSSYIGDLHKTRQPFQLGQLRDSDWRAMAAKQKQMEGRLLADSYADTTDKDGKVITAATHRENDAVALAQTYEVFDSVTQKVREMGGDPSDPEQYAAAGVSAAAAPILQAAVRSRGVVTGGATPDITFKTANPDGTRTLDISGKGPMTIRTTGDLDRTGVPRL